MSTTSETFVLETFGRLMVEVVASFFGQRFVQRAVGALPVAKQPEPRKDARS